MKKKIRVGILFGGRSAEHEVSLISARNIVSALDPQKYEPILIGIAKDGSWHQLPSPSLLQEVRQVKDAALPAVEKQESSAPMVFPSQFLQPTSDAIDVIFPVLHGPYGEDGTVQGLLKLFNIPFVGASVLGSAVGMDKDVMKRLFRDAGLPIVKFKAVTHKERKKLSFERIKAELHLPLFIKPANLGSSIGVSKVTDEQSFYQALDKAFQYDTKVLIEEGLSVREIECSVLGNDEKIASVAGEIIPTHEFYDYEAKYIDENGAGLQIPADITPEQLDEIQQLAIQACEILCIDGMARVDFFLIKDTGKVYLNEVNTIPGFTSISMYPKLWEASGIAYSELIDRLIQLALERHRHEQKLNADR